jgi:hypothetical protein
VHFELPSQFETAIGRGSGDASAAVATALRFVSQHGAGGAPPPLQGGGRGPQVLDGRPGGGPLDRVLGFEPEGGVWRLLQSGSGQGVQTRRALWRAPRRVEPVPGGEPGEQRWRCKKNAIPLHISEL